MGVPLAILKATDGAIRLPGSSNAETALASRMDILVTNNVWIIQSFVVKCRRGRCRPGFTKLKLAVGDLMRDGGLEKGGSNAKDGE